MRGRCEVCTAIFFPPTDAQCLSYRRDLITSTAALSALSSFLIGLFANLPIGMAPGLSLNAYVRTFYYPIEVLTETPAGNLSLPTPSLVRLSHSFQSRPTRRCLLYARRISRKRANIIPGSTRRCVPRRVSLNGCPTWRQDAYMLFLPTAGFSSSFQ